MTTSTTRLRRGLLVGAASLAMLLAACGSDNKDNGSNATTTAGGTSETTTATTAGGATTTGGGTTETTAGGSAAADLKGKSVTILGPEVGAEADGVTEAFKAFEDQTGAKVEYTGSKDAETQVRTAAQAGGDALPDIFFAPQPGLVKDLSKNITPLSDDLATKVKADYDPYFATLVTFDNKVYGVPAKADVKSLVWYSPKLFKEKGYTVPKTWDEMIALQEKIKTDGGTPWCVAIGSGDATGWPFTDWMEDIMLRKYGPDVYDQWVQHKIPFNDPKVKDVADQVGKIWFDDKNVLGGRSAIASTNFADEAQPILNGDCLMYRQANFFGANFVQAKPDVKFGDDGDISVFYLPTMSDQFGKVLLAGGVYAVAFNDKPETQAALAYIESADYANNRIKANKGGFLSPNKNHDTSLYNSELDRTLANILVTASPLRFDASDQMPSDVGAGTFWKDGTNFVAGTEDIDTFLNNVEKSWPAS
jgi:alpha-glucoside transport system substrate-binding protein